MVNLKQIKIFKDIYEGSLEREVNDYIRNNKVKINDIQYSSTGGSFYKTQYSVLIVIDDDKV